MSDAQVEALINGIDGPKCETACAILDNMGKYNDSGLAGIVVMRESMEQFPAYDAASNQCYKDACEVIHNPSSFSFEWE